MDSDNVLDQSDQQADQVPAPRPESVAAPTAAMASTPSPRRRATHSAGDHSDRPVTSEMTIPTNIYRAKRPAFAALLIIPAVLVGLLLVRALAISAFGSAFLINGVIASSLALASLPLIVTGLYGLLTGAAFGAEQWGFRVWARPPLAYLLVGLAFAIGAAIAVG